MRKNRISETIGNINQKYVNEATAYTGEVKAVRHPVWMKWGAVAACLCLIVAAMVAVPNLFGDNAIKDETIISDSNLFGDNAIKDETIISGFKSGSLVDACYATPVPGEYFCFIEVNEARKEYAGKDVSFLLSFDVFNRDGEQMSIEELGEEYQRLSDLGYKLYYVEDHWTYYGDNQKEYSPVVVGLFTEDELTNFKASEQYGYAFHFETNGDGSSVSIDEENVVTNFNSVLY